MERIPQRIVTDWSVPWLGHIATTAPMTERAEANSAMPKQRRVRSGIMSAMAFSR